MTALYASSCDSVFGIKVEARGIATDMLRILRVIWEALTITATFPIKNMISVRIYDKINCTIGLKTVSNHSHSGTSLQTPDDSWVSIKGEKKIKVIAQQITNPMREFFSSNCWS